MLLLPNSRLLMSIAFTAAVAAFAAAVACNDESSPSIDSLATNATLDSAGASCDPLAQSNVIPCGQEGDDDRESSPYLDSLTTNSYLVATVEPCAPLAQSDIDPCERRLDEWDIARTPYHTGHPHRRESHFGPPAVETTISLGYRDPDLIPHMIVRGTVVPGSTRCDEPNAWLIGSFRDTAEITDWKIDMCFAEFRVSEYIVGRGPSVLTIKVGQHYKVSELPVDEWFDWLEGIHSVFEGSEWVAALRVPTNFVYSVWWFWDSRSWDVQRRHDGTVVVVDYQARYHSQLPREENGYEVTLDEFRETARRLHAEYLLAHGGRIGDFEGAPRIVNDANYEFLHAHMSRSPVFDIVDATPRAAPPPPS